jgi:periplasmic mercuric ion binding protein
MKKFIFLFTAVFLFAMVSIAQSKRPEWVTIKTPNVRCWECKVRLENYMSREIGNTQSGIIKMQINMLSGTTRVQYLPDRVNLSYIRTAFNNAGFDADEELATEDSYKKLPPSCKRNEEGGGPKKGKPCHVEPYRD